MIRGLKLAGDEKVAAEIKIQKLRNKNRIVEKSYTYLLLGHTSFELTTFLSHFSNVF